MSLLLSVCCDLQIACEYLRANAQAADSLIWVGGRIPGLPMQVLPRFLIRSPAFGRLIADETEQRAR
jgi:hypothetical protein